jgi:tripeptide aminopeptidase
MANVQRDRVVQEFIELCRIDSPAREEAAIAVVLEQRLRALGLEVRNDGRGPSTGNLIGRLPATGPGQPILLTAHMDTVEPGRGVQPRLIDDVVCSDGVSTILGADCKAGVVAILEGLRVLQERGMPGPLVEVVITWGEEIGHLGARELDFSEFDAKLGFCLDALCPVGTIVNQAPGYDWVRAVFKGRGAHAGVEPELGVSAIVAAAHAIAAMELGRIDAETTSNIGLIRGGTARNAVPSEVIIEGEARSRDAGKLAAQVEHLRSCFNAGARAAGAEVDVEVEHEFLAYQISPGAPVARLALAAGRRAGLEPIFAATGGGSDANNFNAAGLPMVVLGIGCSGAHTVNERIAISELEALSRYVVALVDEARDLS